MHIHILGICGTFMGGVALLAKQLGYRVSGSDTNVYPPMSDQLAEQGIELSEGYEPNQLQQRANLIVIGNALSRGNPAVEYALDNAQNYQSGPEFLARHILPQRWVLAVAGTHGKTTTSSMLAWILEHTGLKPGFLIGGIAEDFGLSARLGSEPFFVVEADEYDTAFFDKRSKFVHYRPRTLVLNNLEFDHADIFADLDAIKTQFHHLLRTVPSQGLIIAPTADEAIEDVLQRGCWTPLERFGQNAELNTAAWQADEINAGGNSFAVSYGNKSFGRVDWSLCGQHNISNALAAIAAARHAGVPPQHAIAALNDFQGVKRRLELRATINGIRIYDDFAHHPTAIQLTLEGLRQQVGSARIIAVLEARSNTMRMGIHSQQLPQALQQANQVILYQAPEQNWDMRSVEETITVPTQVFKNSADIIQYLTTQAKSGDHILIMSNGGFENIHNRLITALDPS